MVEARTAQIATWCDVLSVSPAASDAVIRAAGKALLSHCHPDRAVDEADRVHREEQAKAISAAVAGLCDARNAPRTKATPTPGAGQAPPGTERRDRPGPGAGHTSVDRSSWDDVLATMQRIEGRQPRPITTRRRPVSASRTWTTVLGVAGLWVWGMVRWWDGTEAYPSFWLGLLAGGFLLAAVVTWLLWEGTTHGQAVAPHPGHGRTTVLVGALLFAAPALLGVLAIAGFLGSGRRWLLAASGTGRGATLVAGTVLVGLWGTGTGQPLGAGLAPLTLVAVGAFLLRPARGHRPDATPDARPATA
jgi:hypothetical protein